MRRSQSSAATVLRALGALALSVLCLSPSPARAQATSPPPGFSLNRYEPTAAGEWSFWVDRPWYSATRRFAAGLTLNYAHEPLVFGRRAADGSFSQIDTVIGHQLLGHVDLAASFWDRLTVSATVPVVLLERGQEFAGIKPISGVAVGDPRIGGMVRLWRQPDQDAISLSAGLYLWIPIRGIDSSQPPQSSDSGIRLMPKLVLAGAHRWLHWSAVAAFLYRPESTIGNLANPSGSSVGSEIQLGAAAYYADMERRFKIGPELMLGTVVVGGNGFKSDYTSLELLLGGHYSLFRQVLIGLAGGFGALRTPGTPDFRMLLRVAWAPWGDRGPRDRDRDGILDNEDACPDTAGVRQSDPRTNGCPEGDRDGDGVLDRLDQCPDTPQGKNPDPARQGCPLGDRDGDGVFDNVDQCPDVPKGPKPDPTQPGCPDGDRDRDGVVDHEDQCPDEAAGMHPDPQRPGCPMPDRDKDTVPDVNDACPDKPGAPHPDPKKNGCPSVVEVKDGQIRILKPVFFATDKDVILAKSFPVLQAVADAMTAEMSIKKLRIEGHTDSRGALAHNMDLSDRRAKSVLKWISEHGGVDPSRLEAVGYGPTRPIQDNKTEAGRAANRRVEFHITDPAQSDKVQTAPAGSVQSPDPTDKKK